MNAWNHTYSATQRRDHPPRLAILCVFLLGCGEMLGLCILGVQKDYAAFGAGLATVVKEHVRRRLFGE